MTIFQMIDVGFNIHPLTIMGHETTCWLPLSSLGLASTWVCRVTSVYLVSFYFNSYLILNLTKAFLSLQACFLMSLEAVGLRDHMSMGQMSQEGSLIAVA